MSKPHPFGIIQKRDPERMRLTATAAARQMSVSAHSLSWRRVRTSVTLAQ
jgi:hypothetical protein